MPNTHQSTHSFVNEQVSHSGQLVPAEQELTVGARLIGGHIQIEVCAAEDQAVIGLKQSFGSNVIQLDLAYLGIYYPV